MGQPLFSNNAFTTLSVGCASGDATLTVTSSTTFPAVLTASGNWFYACLQDTFANLEIVKVTNVSGSVWTVARAIGGTTARAFASGAVVELRMTADYLTDVYTYAITGNLQNSTPQWLTSVAGTNTITASLTPALTAYTNGQTFRLVTAGANTGAATININSLGAKALTKQGGAALVSGDVAASSAYEIMYDGTQFQLVGGAPATNATNLNGSGTISDTTTINGVKVGYRNVPQNSQSAAYTTVIGDAGKHIYHPTADTTARTFTIDSNANVAYDIGTAITFVNDTSAGVVTISIAGTDVLVLAGTGTTGSRTLAANGIATALKVTSTRWIISGSGLT